MRRLHTTRPGSRSGRSLRASASTKYPVGATGAILAVKLMYELQRKKAHYGLVSLCIGGGQGIATIFERLD